MVKRMKCGRFYLVLFLLILLIAQESSFISSAFQDQGAVLPGRSGDDEPPRMLVDSTPSTAETGGRLNFSAEFTDNVSIAEVRVNYTQLGAVFNVSMEFQAGQTWNRTVTVDDNATSIGYHFYFRDTSNNTNVSQPRAVFVDDVIPPVADAGEDLVILPKEPFDLNASLSTDNIGIVNFTWYWPAPGGCGKEFHEYGEVVEVRRLGRSINVTLTATDAAGNQATDMINVTVLDVEDPIPYPGEDVTIDQFETVEFNGNGSMDNRGIANYTWSIQYNQTRFYLYGVRVNFAFDIPGVYEVLLRTIDTSGNGAGVWGNMTVFVRDIIRPVAEAGEDVAIDQHETLVFDGTGCHDNTNVTAYFWNFTYRGQHRSLVGESPSFKFDQVGIYRVGLEIRDNWGNKDNDSLRVTVRDITPPVAYAGADRKVDYGDRFYLDAGDSSDNVGVVNYSWSFNYNDTVRTVYGMEMSFASYVMGAMDFHLTISDAAGNKGYDVCSVTVLDSVPPKVDAGFDVRVGEGTAVHLDAGLTTDHSLIVHYNWSFDYNGSEKKLYGREVTFTFHRMGEYTVFLFVMDMYGNMGWDALTVEVLDVTPPRIDAGDDMKFAAGSSVPLNATGEDNVAIENYTWTFTYDGTETALFGIEVNFTFEIPGNYTVELVASDAEGNTARDNVTVLVLAAEDPGPDDDTAPGNGNGTGNDGGADTGSAGISTGMKMVIASAMVILLIIAFTYLLNRRLVRDAGGTEEKAGMEAEPFLEPDHHFEEGSDDTTEGDTDPTVNAVDAEENIDGPVNGSGDVEA